jgi:hypothetical protein
MQATIARASSRRRIKWTRLVALVGNVEGSHVGRHRASRRPEREHHAHDDHHDAGGGVAVEAGETTAEQLRRLLRHHASKVMHERRDRLRASQQREHAERDQ